MLIGTFKKTGIERGGDITLLFLLYSMQVNTKLSMVKLEIYLGV